MTCYPKLWEFRVVTLGIIHMNWYSMPFCSRQWLCFLNQLPNSHSVKMIHSFVPCNCVTLWISDPVTTLQPIWWILRNTESVLNFVSNLKKLLLKLIICYGKPLEIMPSVKAKPLMVQKLQAWMNMSMTKTKLMSITKTKMIKKF